MAVEVCWAERATRAVPASRDAQARGRERRTRGRAGWGAEAGQGGKGGCRAGEQWEQHKRLHRGSPVPQAGGVGSSDRPEGPHCCVRLRSPSRIPQGSRRAGSTHVSGVFIQAGGTPVSFEASPRERARSTPLLPAGLPELRGCRGTGRNLEAIAPVRLSSGNAVPSSFPLRKHNPRG